MNISSAKDIVFRHAGMSSVSKSQTGFLPALRPYRGVSIESFFDLALAIIDLSDSIEFKNPEVDRDVVYALWSIVARTRQWALDPNGMLMRNQLIDEATRTQLKSWVDVIENSSLALLCAAEGDYVAHPLVEYVLENEVSDPPQELTRVATDMLKSASDDHRLSAVRLCERFGRRAHQATSLLSKIAAGDPQSEIREIAHRALQVIQS
jgi:hypothetical protein